MWTFRDLRHFFVTELFREYEKRRAELDHRIDREERIDKLSRLSRDESK